MKQPAKTKTDADRYITHLSQEVGRACTKWLQDRGIKTESYGPILQQLKKRGLR